MCREITNFNFFFYNKASFLELMGKMPGQRFVPLPFPVGEFLGGFLCVSDRFQQWLSRQSLTQKARYAELRFSGAQQKLSISLLRVTQKPRFNLHRSSVHNLKFLRRLSSFYLSHGKRCPGSDCLGREHLTSGGYEI